VLRIAIVGEENRGRRDDLIVDSVAVHVLEAYLGIPAAGIDVAEDVIAEKDHGFSPLGMTDRRPVLRAVAHFEIGPGSRKEVSMDVDDRHGYLPG